MIQRFKRSTIMGKSVGFGASVPLGLFCTDHVTMGNLLNVLASFLLLYNEHSNDTYLMKLYHLNKLTHRKSSIHFNFLYIYIYNKINLVDFLLFSSEEK